MSSRPSATGRCGRSSSAPGAGLTHQHVGSLHAPDAEMALRNARDVYTRRSRGRVDLGRAGRGDHRVQPGREGLVLRPGGRQGLPAPDVLRDPGRGAAPVNRRPRHRWRPTRCGSATTRWCWPSGSASGSPTRRSSRRTSRWPTSASTCSARRAPCSPTPVRSRAPAAARTTWPTCATSASSSTCTSSSARTTTSRSRIARQLLFSTYQLALYERPAPPAPTRPSPASPRRRSRRSTTTATTPPSGRCASATAPTSRTAGCRPGSSGSGRTPTSCSAPTTVEQALVADGVAVDASTLRAGLGRLRRPRCSPRPRSPGRTGCDAPGGGRRGIHTEALGYLLAEMQHLHRAHPGASW